MPSFRDIVFTISSVSDVSEVLPFSVWMIFARKQRPYFLLGIFLGLLFLVKVYTLITAEFDINNMPAYHFLALLEIIAVYCFYCQLLYQRIYSAGILVLAILHIINTFFYQNILTFNSMAWTADMVLIIGFGLFYFLKIYNNEDDYSPLQRRPDFIITVGWLLYASGSLFTYLMASDILSGYAAGFFKNGWFFQTVSNIIKDIIISYGFWLTKKK
jgi:hypothetical protein